ncbi:predicted protein [Aspergillus terreus NIH2624]|uniref:Non-haem dioxygenase N-terminal domain-containing protein n=1 Tax=Aspergillus terreus (strain NIH 2624 / FGSC A1156) TaxID=341663 RepID=Q0CEF9_ASPTN|nr:uncharacterized protein ATEG_07925 [Aspergillus terreus NIH2624]EAU32187.1 predicted protein [Aspergillus terreus NIH2624]
MGADTVKTYFGDLQVEAEVVQGDFDNLPIIDVASLDSPDIEDRKQLAAQIFDACTRVGFFYIKRFHGYSPLGGEHSDKELFGEQTNLSESFDIGYDIECDPDKSCADSLPPDPYELYGGNLWPSPEVLPGFKETYVEYFKACLRLSRKLMRIFALALGLEEGYFDQFVTFPGCMSRILHYPPQPVPGEEKVGIEAHTVGYSSLSVRAQTLKVLGLRMLHYTGPGPSAGSAGPQYPSPVGERTAASRDACG